jgi:hypothetical protein
MNTSAALQRIIVAAFSLAGCAASFGTTVVFSNLESAAEGDSARLLDSHGDPLAAGSWIRLGHFGNLGPVEIVSLAGQGKDALLAAFVPFGVPSSLGNGASGNPGRIEFPASAPLAAPLQSLHAVVFNASSPDTATELLVVKLPDAVPMDDPSGLVGYLAVHLEDAVLLAGTATSDGISTTPTGGVFQAWMAGQVTGEIPPDELLPNGDADADGFANLLEYGLGSHAGNSGSRPEMALLRETGVLRMRFLRRSDDPGLDFVLETSASMAEQTWVASPSSPLEVPSPPFPAPEGFLWMQYDLPMASNRIFARLRVTTSP